MLLRCGCCGVVCVVLWFVYELVFDLSVVVWLRVCV